VAGGLVPAVREREQDAQVVLELEERLEEAAVLLGGRAQELRQVAERAPGPEAPLAVRRLAPLAFAGRLASRRFLRARFLGEEEEDDDRRRDHGESGGSAPARSRS